MEDRIPWANYGVKHNNAVSVFLEDSVTWTNQDSNNAVENNEFQ